MVGSDRSETNDILVAMATDNESTSSVIESNRYGLALAVVIATDLAPVSYLSLQFKTEYR